MFAEQGKRSIASCQAFGRKAGVRELEQVRRSWQSRCSEASSAFGSKAGVRRVRQAFGRSKSGVREQIKRSIASCMAFGSKSGVREQERVKTFASKADVR